MEIWREYGHGYFVSDVGRVRGVSGRILKPRMQRNGYCRVTILGKDVYIHAMVLEAFVSPRPSPNHEADHLNLIRDDNRLENLRWLTLTENRERRRRTIGERNGCSKLTADQIEAIRASGGSSRKIAVEFGVTARHVRRIRRGDRWNSL